MVSSTTHPSNKTKRVLGYVLVPWLKVVGLKLASLTHAWIQILKRLNQVIEHLLSSKPSNPELACIKGEELNEEREE